MRPALLAIFCFVCALDLGRAESVWSSYVNTNRYEFTVSDAALAETPVWKDNQEEPPLAPRKALRLARALLTELVYDSNNIELTGDGLNQKRHGHWALDSLNLKELGDDGHWVYLVVFQWIPPSGIIQGMAARITIPVLMSGVAVKAKIKPESK